MATTPGQEGAVSDEQITPGGGNRDAAPDGGAAADAGGPSRRVFDHTSILALVEAKWNLPALTYRDANANNMLDMLDLRHPAFLTPPALAQPLLDTDPGALACNTSGPGTIPPPGSVTPPHHHGKPYRH